jgi:hypothetical protein
MSRLSLAVDEVLLSASVCVGLLIATFEFLKKFNMGAPYFFDFAPIYSPSGNTLSCGMDTRYHPNDSGGLTERRDGGCFLVTCRVKGCACRIIDC